MNHCITRSAAAAALALAGTVAVGAPALADPGADGGVQTMVCDNGATYVAHLKGYGRGEKSASFEHGPLHDPLSNAVLTPISGSGMVTITEDGESFSFPYEFANPRVGDAGRVTSCQSTYDVSFGTSSVHVEGVDVVLVSGAR